jgi:hypothetical protein
VNRRKPQGELDRDHCKALQHAWIEAFNRGYPLNAFITIRPPNANDLTPDKRAELIDKFWNRLAIWLRRRTTFYCILVREAAPNGKDFGIGEHFHALVHVPHRHFNSLKMAIASWHPEPREALVKRADYKVRRTQQGKITSAFGYLTKQRSPRAWYLTDYTRKRGGKVLGKRYRISANLRAKPIARTVPRPQAGPGNSELSQQLVGGWQGVKGVATQTKSP